MQIIISVSDSFYDRLMSMNSDSDTCSFNESALVASVQNGTPLQKGHVRAGMTREEQIERLIKIEKIGALDDKDRQALNIQIKSLEQEPCEDTVSRQAVLDAISRIGLFKSSTKEVQAVAECLMEVEALPPVNALEQDPKTDTWSIKDVADTLAKHGLIVERQESEE